ncbi:hypothetical protein HWV62_7690 [Athelia sp. TMB]|nr:hypothetical protein HWV62_7690 [Athelia sp. TMB]
MDTESAQSFDAQWNELSATQPNSFNADAIFSSGTGAQWPPDFSEVDLRVSGSGAIPRTSAAVNLPLGSGFRSLLEPMPPIRPFNDTLDSYEIPYLFNHPNPAYIRQKLRATSISWSNFNATLPYNYQLLNEYAFEMSDVVLLKTGSLHWSSTEQALGFDSAMPLIPLFWNSEHYPQCWPFAPKPVIPYEINLRDGILSHQAQKMALYISWATQYMVQTSEEDWQSQLRSPLDTTSYPIRADYIYYRSMIQWTTMRYVDPSIVPQRAALLHGNYRKALRITEIFNPRVGYFIPALSPFDKAMEIWKLVILQPFMKDIWWGRKPFDATSDPYSWGSLGIRMALRFKRCVIPVELIAFTCMIVYHVASSFLAFGDYVPRAWSDDDLYVFHSVCELMRRPDCQNIRRGILREVKAMWRDFARQMGIHWRSDEEGTDSDNDKEEDGDLNTFN